MFFQSSTDTLNMNTLKKTMIKKAKSRFKKILPCGRRRSLKQCFTVEKDKVFFWFNTEDESTHLMVERLD